MEPTDAMFRIYPADTRYYYHQLTDNEKRLFSEFYDCVAACRTKVFVQGRYTLAEYDHALNAIWKDCPEFIHQYGGVSYSSNGNYLTSVNFGYSMSKAELDNSVRQMVNRIQALKNDPDYGTSDFSKQYVIYRHLIRNNYYDCEKEYCGEANSTWLLGYGSCQGYTRGLNLSLRYHGIQCCEIGGVAGGGGHCWTGINLDGIWYHCDVTWDDPVVADNPANDPFDRTPAYLPYMNIPEAVMMRNRTLDIAGGFSIPRCTSMTHNYAVQNGTYHAAGAGDARTAIHNSMTRAYQAGQDCFMILFESQSDYLNARNNLTQYLRSWQYGGAQYNGCTWSDNDDVYMLQVYNLRFR
jgi:hypothetical protein